ncbi:hypothetical protein GTR04_3536 [Trichophyton interdigitale]|uniref:Uncharacterized protein n=1 Tax=Trichophyton interdigitale TaxID=101480 RepID=A0A9P4YIA1_9EURO|nr:hypothetical protein GY631_3310 [Trichophyton interdigitale]KAF3896223.1 hypothetical protein GY632_2908 [Trichophyton interdigitale]KAG8209077.1 hypothetical protein GTR04_3536 [Trichophyton interdigitale]
MPVDASTTRVASSGLVSIWLTFCLVCSCWMYVMNETYVSDAERLGQLRRGKGINNTSNCRAGEQKIMNRKFRMGYEHLHLLNLTALSLEGGHLTACRHRRRIFEQSGNSQTGPIPLYWIFPAARRECWCNIRPSGNGIAGMPQVSLRYLRLENPAAKTKPASGRGQKDDNQRPLEPLQPVLPNSHS